MEPGFEFQPTLSDGALTVRPMRGEDREPLQITAADPEIWAGHPVKDRWRRQVFAPYFDFLLSTGGAVVFVDEKTERIIGCSRFYMTTDKPEGVSIDFTFLTRDHWGGGTNRAIKRLMLNHIFASGENAWFHIDPSNIRSQKATAKLGARHVFDAEHDLGSGMTTWMCFLLLKADWAAATS